MTTPVAQLDWHKPFVWSNNLILQPLKKADYEKIENWDGKPLFWYQEMASIILRPIGKPSLIVVVPFSQNWPKSIQIKNEGKCDCSAVHGAVIKLERVFDEVIRDR